MLRYSKRHEWCDEQDSYLIENSATHTIEEMSQYLGISRGRIKYRLDKLKTDKKYKDLFPEEVREIPAAIEDAIHWSGGMYWRLPPKLTWHKGFTGRLIHKSTTTSDFEFFK